MKKIKVLVVIEQSSISYKYFENILIAFKNHPNYEIDVLNLINNDRINEHLGQFCSKVFNFPNDKPYKKQLLNIRKIITTSNPDIIHAHEVIPSFYSAMALLAMGSRKKLIFHRHHSFYRNLATRIMEKIAFFRCNLAISVSKTTQKVAFMEHPFSKKKIVQLYNGITVVGNDVPLPFNIGHYENKFKIVLLSRLRSGKGHFTAIEAINIVRHTIPNIVLFFAGEGDYRKEIAAKIEEKKLQEHVILTGDIVNVKGLLDVIDISILPSESEAFNLSILETFACSKLSVASNLPSIKECITDGITGVLIEPNDASALANKIIYYFNNEKERLEIAANGKRLYEQKFTTSVMVNGMVSLYAKLLHYNS